MKLLRTFSLITAATLVIGLINFLAIHPASASFNSNNIIDDAVFNNTGSMSASQIDDFLNKFPNSCISQNSGFEAKIPNGYSPSGGFTFGNFASAGNVISAAANTYSINPQVLLATLEKEQSLVTGQNNFSGYCNNGDQNKYTAAVGYGCPDGGTVYNWSGVSLYRRNGVEQTTTGSTCVNAAAKAGFSQQIIRAAWLLKFGQQRSYGNVSWAVVTGSWDNSDDPATCYGGPMVQGTRQRCTGGPAVYYDGLLTIDGSTIHVDNGPTAALYWYTPHFHGNQNFVSIFEAWFGSTHSNDAMRNGTAGEGGGNTASWNPGRLDIFIQGTNPSGPNMWHKWFDGVNWNGYEQDPAAGETTRITSQIAAASWGPNQIDLFARSETGTLLHKQYQQYFGWGKWEDMGGCIIGAPTVTSWGVNRLDVFVEGCNGAGINMHHRWYDGSWHDWEVVPGMNARISAPPSAVSWGPNRIDIFARGEDGALIHNWYGGVWYGIDSQGGCIIGQPAVASWSPGRLDVFVQSCNDVGANMSHKWYDNNTWYQWELTPLQNGTRVTSMLGAVSWDRDRLDVFGRGNDGTLIHQWYYKGWNVWESLSGGVAP